MCAARQLSAAVVLLSLCGGVGAFRKKQRSIDVAVGDLVKDEVNKPNFDENLPPMGRNLNVESQNDEISDADSLLEASASHCSDFGCTCQGLSDYYGSDAGISWGCTPESAKQWWIGRRCHTRPRGSPSGCKDQPCAIFGCECQGMSDYFGAIAGVTWGCAPNWAQDFWKGYPCKPGTRPRPGTMEPGCQAATQFTAPTGKWKQVASNNGEISKTLQEGFQYEDSKTEESSDTSEKEVSVATSVTVGGGGVVYTTEGGLEVTMAASYSHAWSESVTSSKSLSVTDECTAKCSAADLQNKFPKAIGWMLYQWQLGATSGTKGKIGVLTCHYLCIPKFPGKANAPAAPLGCCGDSECSYWADSPKCKPKEASQVLKSGTEDTLKKIKQERLDAVADALKKIKQERIDALAAFEKQDAELARKQAELEKEDA